jgi:HTH-type transcriptional regulator/antitoxin HipB
MTKKPTSPTETFECAAEQKAAGAMLRAMRLDAGMTQAQVAEIMGTGEKAVRRLEKEEANPTIKTLFKFAAATGHDLTLLATPIASDAAELTASEPETPE